MLKQRLQIAEYVFLLVSVLGWAVAVWTGHLIYAAVPVSIAFLLNLLNRLGLEQQIKRRLPMAINQSQRQLVEESYALYQQQLQEAIASLKAQIPEYLTQLESSELKSSALKIIQFKEQLTSLEESLNSVVQYLNNESLPSRVEELEEAIEAATVEISWIHRQLTDTKHNSKDDSLKQLQRSQPEGLIRLTEPQGFVSEPTLAVPIAPPPESVPVEESQPVLPPPQTWSLSQTLSGHSDWVHALAITPDGQTLVSGSFDKMIKLWYFPTGKLIRTLSQHSKGVLSLAISPDGQTLASGSFDETIRVWHLQGGELIHTLKGHTSSVRSLVISEDSQTLISGSFDETIKLWRLDKGEFLGNVSQWTGQVSAIALSPDGQTLATAGGDGIITLRVIDTTTGEIKISPAITLTGNLSSVSSLAMTPDGEILAAGCTDGTIKLWQLGTLKALNIIEGHAGPVMSVVFSMDSPTLISGSADGTIKIWHPQTGQQLAILADESPSSVMSVAISPDGQLIASGGADSKIKIWQRD